MIHHKAKSIVKSNAKTKDTALIWQLICETYDKSMSTSLNGDAILGWLTGSRLDDGKWNQTQGEYITFYEDKINKFNEMCPNLVINDMQGVRMLQNLIANVPNLANILIAWRQTKAAAGLSDKITLRQFIALQYFPNKLKSTTMEEFVQVVTIVEVQLTMNSIMRSMLTTSMKTKKVSMNGSRRM